MMSNVFAESVLPPNPINSFTLSLRVLEKSFKNSHYRVIGSCLWLRGASTEPGIAIEQFLPDLVVTVSNQPGSNPWQEVGALYDNKIALKGYQTAFMSVTGLPFDHGDGSSQQLSQHINEARSRVVHVIGSPAKLYRLPKVTHLPETTWMKPYYSSLADAVSDRTEAGEIAYMATHPTLLMSGYIGTATNHWGSELPRIMTITQASRYRASVVAAMHAADIVTNKSSGHVAQWTTNRCGPNCVIANVIYDPKHKKVIWQEIYPLNRNINPGDPADFGEIDDVKGNGNYVFVVWRKYKGCVKHRGKLIWSTPHVGKAPKR